MLDTRAFYEIKRRFDQLVGQYEKETDADQRKALIAEARMLVAQGREIAALLSEAGVTVSPPSFSPTS
jgi:hypothetical protein